MTCTCATIQLYSTRAMFLMYAFDISVVVSWRITVAWSSCELSPLSTSRYHRDWTRPGCWKSDTRHCTDATTSLHRNIWHICSSAISPDSYPTSRNSSRHAVPQKPDQHIPERRARHLRHYKQHSAWSESWGCLSPTPPISRGQKCQISSRNPPFCLFQNKIGCPPWTNKRFKRKTSSQFWDIRQNIFDPVSQ